MAARKMNSEPEQPNRPPATTPQARENQMIALAVDLVEKQIIEGTASSQVLTHYLKLASSRERKEQQKLELETAFLQDKREAMASSARSEELYENILTTIKGYQGEDIDGQP